MTTETLKSPLMLTEREIRDYIAQTLDSWRGAEKKYRYVYEIDDHAGNQDWLAPGEVKTIIESECPDETLDEILIEQFEPKEDEECLEILNAVLDNMEDNGVDLGDEEATTALMNHTLSILYDMLCFNLPYEHFLKHTFQVDIGLELENIDKDTPTQLMTWLAEKQGYTKEQLEAAFQGQKSALFLEACVVEAKEVMTSENALTFLVNMTLEDLIDLCELKKEANAGTITLGAGTVCGLFNRWKGAGSLMEMELEKPIDIPVDRIEKVMLDGAPEIYGFDDCYFLYSGCWKDTFLSINR